LNFHSQAFPEECQGSLDLFGFGLMIRVEHAADNGFAHTQASG